jgi:hypothetical protein
MRLLSSFLILACLLLAGCESLPGGEERAFDPAQAKVQVFDGEVRAVYQAAKLAFKRLDCELTDESGAPSRLEAASRIVSSDSLGDSRQLVIQLRLRGTEDDKTEVAMTISLQVESAGLGGPSAQTKREHGFYDIYFAALQQSLVSPVAAP